MRKASKFIEIVQAHSYYSVYMMNDKPIVVYEDHRFIIPILWLAHNMNIVPKNINMVRYDDHLDDCLFQNDALSEYKDLDTFNKVFTFSENKLEQLNDDWLSFAVQTNLISRVLTFCDQYKEPLKQYEKRMFRLNYLQDKLGSRGTFGDHLYSTNNDYHMVIGWNLKEKKMINDPIFFDIDCDYFTFKWREKHYPWQKEFYDFEFSNSPEHVDGWSNLTFIKKIIARSPFVTICLEHGCCGGENNVKDILTNLNSILFNGVIRVDDFYKVHE